MRARRALLDLRSVSRCTVWHHCQDIILLPTSVVIPSFASTVSLIGISLMVILNASAKMGYMLQQSNWVVLNGLFLVFAHIPASGASDRSVHSSAQDVVKPFAVAGYLPEWRYLQWSPEEHLWRWDALSEHLTHLIIFSIEVGLDGEFAAMDRFPPRETMALARAAADKHGTKLLICFGGNSRTGAFPTMVLKKKTRQKFIKNLIALCKEHQLDGVDYNWEYPTKEKEWSGLFHLIRETKKAFKKSHDPAMEVTMAYYPDTRQENIIAKANILESLDLAHMMSYDQRGKHSTWEFGKQAVDQGIARIPAAALTMGLPFYARDMRTGDWTTYEDIVKKHAGGSIAPEIDEVGNQYFNGVSMIEQKTKYALDQHLGGVMIWEVGQDNFINEESALHQENSLLRAISRVINANTPQNTKDEL